MGFDLADVKLALLEGDRDEALRLLVQAVSDDWQFQWRFQLADPIFDEIRDAPEFQQAIETIRARVAEQNTRIAENQVAAADG